MLTPKVVGFELSGSLPEGSTATDLVLIITELLRQRGVVWKFVEFFGPGVASVSLENRATIGNMSPEYGAACAIFPIDNETLRYLRFTGRRSDRVALVEAYAKEQGLWHDPLVEPQYSERLSLDLSTVVPSLAGPSRPQDRVPLDRAQAMFAETLGCYLVEHHRTALKPRRSGVPSQDLPLHVRNASPEEASADSFPASDPPAAMSGVTGEGDPSEAVRAPRRPNRAALSTVPVRRGKASSFDVDHGTVVIAAITSCTNTSNPSVMVAAGLLAKRAVESGLTSKPWVKTSLAPGSKVVTDYYDRAGLTPYLDKLGFQLFGYGCTTCIGMSFGHGAPLRLRNEIEFGFKQVKWIKGIEFLAHFSDVGSGEGGYNQDHEFFGYRQSI